MITYKGYANIDLIRRPNRVQGSIHRMVAECFISNPENKPFVDHINENTGDDRVENLRWATNSDNQRNIGTNRSNNTSGYKGINAKTHKGSFVGWQVRIGVDKSRIHLGTYNDIEEAMNIRQDAVNIFFGEFAPK